MRQLLTTLFFLLVSVSISAQEKPATLWKVIDNSGHEVYASQVYLPATDIESIDVLKGEGVEPKVKKDGYDLLIVAKIKEGVVPVTLKDYFKNKKIKAKKIAVKGKEENKKYPSITKNDMSIEYSFDGKVVDISMPETKISEVRIR